MTSYWGDVTVIKVHPIGGCVKFVDLGFVVTHGFDAIHFGGVDAVEMEAMGMSVGVVENNA
jgi:hypothetical protein